MTFLNKIKEFSTNVLASLKTKLSYFNRFSSIFFIFGGCILLIMIGQIIDIIGKFEESNFQGGLTPGDWFILIPISLFIISAVVFTIKPSLLNKLQEKIKKSDEGKFKLWTVT